MIPMTVPKRPMNGVTDPVVANQLKDPSRVVISALAALRNARSKPPMLRMATCWSMGLVRLHVSLGLNPMIQLPIAGLEDAGQR